MAAAAKKSKKVVEKPAAQEAPAHAQTARNIRETVESIVVAFVLAFLFRTFEAEAFVIPTGSMAPTLMGQHKDVYCDECGYRYQASASSEDDKYVQQWRAKLKVTRNPQERAHYERLIMQADIASATCPMCRWTQPVGQFRPEFLRNGSREVYGNGIARPSYSGDRIIVSKLAYTFADPSRWDVVVFRYPGEAQQNYIKRMIGLPRETVRIYGGDIFVRPSGAGAEDGSEGDGFSIASKPPHKVLAMMQAVHDTRHFPVELEQAGWPFRWNALDAAAGAAWKSEVSVESARAGQNAVQRFTTDGSGKDAAWIRYQHTVPDYDDWLTIRTSGGRQGAAADLNPQPQLITDFYAYNTDMKLEHVAALTTLKPPNSKLGLHWVGDLILECDVTVEAATGELLLDLVEGGKHFRCTIDLKSGLATVSIPGVPDFTAAGTTPLNDPDTYHVRFANVDDRLLLWVDDELIDLGGPEAGAPYEVAQVFGGRENIIPQASEDDLGDLAPAGVGSRGAALSVQNLRLLRDVYYIADKHDQGQGSDITDLKVHVYQNMAFGGERNGQAAVRRDGRSEYLTDPRLWPELVDRRHFDFELQENQFFVLGDNSPSSKDSRLWLRGEMRRYGSQDFEVMTPGGHYVERRLLTGKALFVYWPHSWGTVPGTKIPLPFFPNVWDMRLVK